MKNFLNLTKCAAFLFGGMTLFACTDLSGLEERVDSLDSRITALETQVKSLNENITAINGLLTESTFITNVERTENGFSITMSDSEVYTIENGKTGDTPLITVDEDGYWRVKYGDDEYQYITDDGTPDGEKVLATAVAPIFRVTNEGYWEVSTDGGQNFDTVYLEDGHTPAQAIGKDGQDGQPGQDGEDGQDGDTFFRDVQYNEEDGILTLVLADGESYSFTVVSDFACEIDGVTYAEAEIFQPGVSRNFDVIYKGIDDVYLIVPQGWSATLEGETSPAVLTVTPPAAKTKISADSQSDVVVHAVSGDRSIFAKMKVELFDGAIPAAEVKAGAVTATEVNFTVTPNADVTSWKYMLLAASEEAPDAPEDFDTRVTEVQGNTETPLKLDKDANGSALTVGTEYVLYVLAIATNEGVPTYASDIASASATPEYGSYYDMWQAGALTILDKAYNTTDWKAEVISESQDITALTSGTIYFIEPDAIVNVSTNINTVNKVILVGNKPGQKSTITFASGAYLGLNNGVNDSVGGEFVVFNMVFDATNRTNYVILPYRNGTYDYIAFVESDIKYGGQNGLMAHTNTNNSARHFNTFIVESCNIIMGSVEDNTNRQFINLGTLPLNIRQISIKNNIFYCPSGHIADFRMVNAKGASFDNMTIENNIFANVWAKSSVSAAYALYKSLSTISVKNNIFWTNETILSARFFTPASAPDSETAAESAYEGNPTGTVCENNIVYLGSNESVSWQMFYGGLGSVNNTGFSALEEAELIENDPFAGGTCNVAQGEFVPNSTYSSYGPQRN